MHKTIFTCAICNSTTDCIAAVPAGRFPLRLDYAADDISDEGNISEKDHEGDKQY